MAPVAVPGGRSIFRSDPALYPAPPVPIGAGIVLSGKLPHWLYTGLALTYHAAPWLALYQPQLNGAVIVHSRTEKFKRGALLPITAY